MKAKAPFQLTVKDRVLVHLLDHHRPEEGSRVTKVSATISQEGVAEGAWIYLTHASRALRELEKSGLVTERLGYVEGSKRKKKTYRLTPAGISKSQKIKKPLEGKRILVRGLNGGEKKVRLSEAGALLEEELGTRYPTLKIIGSLSDNVLDCKKLLQEEKRYADFMGRIIRLRHFLGKKKSIDKIINAYVAAGEIYLCAGERDRAIEFFKESLEGFAHLGPEKSAGRIRRLRRMYPNKTSGPQKNFVDRGRFNRGGLSKKSFEL